MLALGCLVIGVWAASGIVRLLARKTGRKIFQKARRYDRYPLFPKRHYKIAVFGGSAAAGYTAPLNFSTIVHRELSCRAVTEKPLFLMNFASAGMPFFEGQALLAEKVVGYFDLAIIYAGNNEDQAFCAKLIGLPSKEQKIEHWNSACLARLSLLSRIINFVRESSYITSFIFNVLQRVVRVARPRLARVKGRIRSDGKTRSTRKPPRGEAPLVALKVPMLTNDPVLPKSIKEEHSEQFASAVRDVVVSAERHRKPVLFVAVVNNDLYSPTQSVISGVSDSVMRNVEDTLLDIRARIELNSEGTGDVLGRLLDIQAEHGDSAIVDHLLALTMFRESRVDDGIKYLKRCFNEDCPLIGRSWETKNNRVRDVCSGFENFTFVDPYEKFSRHVAESSTYHQLFSDVQHPSSLGHILLAESILEHFGVGGKEFEDREGKFDEIVNTRDSYYELLGISGEDVANNSFLCIRWHLSCLLLASDKAQYVDRTEHYVEQWWSLVSGGMCPSNYYFWKGVVAANRREEKSMYKWFSRSLKMNEGNFDELISSRGANGEVWWNHLGRLGYRAPL